MRTKTLLKSLPVVTGLLCTSCMGLYYQLYETDPLTDNVKSVEGALVYEDANCMVVYDFWQEAGNAGFAIVNKTDENLYIDKSESFFVKNGVASNYYQGLVYEQTIGRTATQSNSALASASAGVMGSLGASLSASKTGAIAAGAGNVAAGISGTATKGLSASYSEMRQMGIAYGATVSSGRFSSSSVSWEEEKVVVIPPHTSKFIKDQSIHEVLLRYCDFPINPHPKKGITSLDFTQEDSPITFSNVISYKIGTNGETQKIRNDFYVSKITNYPKAKFIGTEYEVWCGEKTDKQYNYFKEYSPKRFYIQYTYKKAQSNTRREKAQSNTRRRVKKVLRFDKEKKIFVIEQVPVKPK